MNTRHLLVPFVFVLTGSLAFPLSAVSVFKWVDSEGVTHFSDETPGHDNMTDQLSQYTIEENFPENRDPDEDYFSIVNQWKRTSDEREARLKSQAERREARRARVPTQTQVLVQEPRRVYSGFIPSPYFFNRANFNRPNHYFHQTPQQPMQPAPPSPGYVGNVAPRN
ncbi:MAG: DUF4124 domain-containing protein [Gammaproteobacteria bacterium]|nr:DUF4124 domain-containing protein [Gammaproteobacteria bacterium]